MARLRQKNSQNYNTSGRVHDEFEGIVRYVNAVEDNHGDLTLSELMAKLFDTSGDFNAAIEARYDATNGLQYRTGNYTAAQAEEGWITVATPTQLRGNAGADTGTITGPLFFDRTEAIATAAQTVFPHNFDDNVADIVVYQNGLLLAETAYTSDAAADTYTLGSGATVSDVLVSFSIRNDLSANYNRQDTVAVGGQAVVSYAHTSDDRLLVYKNGILMREGASYDYTTDPAADTVTMTIAMSASDVHTVITVDNVAIASIGGLMIEDEWTDANGYIPYAKLAIADDDLTQAKVSGLASQLATFKKITSSGSTPSTPAAGDCWVDTSVAPPLLKFFDGVTWYQASPDSTLPSFAAINALEMIRVNSTGTALEYAAVDLSSVVPKTWQAAANGVASLDGTGRLPSSQLPEDLSQDSLYKEEAGATADADYVIQRIFKQKVRIDGVSTKAGTGTCDVTVQIDGVDAGSAIATSTSLSDNTLGSPITVDASSSSKVIGYKVSSGASLADLEVTFAVTNVTS